jgi:predicted metallo-beta-lactamase superfamily hydrolase
MQLKYVAFDSMGVKSSCFMVETRSNKILVDPGIASEVDSYPLSASERAVLADKYEKDIRNACRQADVIIITHYHYDHHIPDKSLYTGKTLLVKHPTEHINKSQQGRAKTLLDGLNADVFTADGKSLTFGKTKIKFHPPAWHGTVNTRLGYVLPLSIQDGKKKVFYSSDVNGPYLPEHADMIIREQPDILLLDGPPTYLLGYIMSYYNLAKSILNINRILEKTKPDVFFLDHHLLRDYRYPDLMHECYRKARERGVRLTTVAEYSGKKPVVLEGFERNGPTKWKHWERFDKEGMIRVLENAVENKLVEKQWLEMAVRL